MIGIQTREKEEFEQLSHRKIIHKLRESTVKGTIRVKGQYTDWIIDFMMSKNSEINIEER